MAIILIPYSTEYLEAAQDEIAASQMRNKAIGRLRAEELKARESVREQAVTHGIREGGKVSYRGKVWTVAGFDTWPPQALGAASDLAGWVATVKLTRGKSGKTTTTTWVSLGEFYSTEAK